MNNKSALWLAVALAMMGGLYLNQGRHHHPPPTTIRTTTTVPVTTTVPQTTFPVTTTVPGYPLGIAPPPLGPGESVLFFDDFASLNTNDWGVYNGTSQPSNGRFLAGNTSVSGGLLNLKMSQDFTNGTSVNNFEVGAGVQLISHTLHAGQRVEFAFKNLPMPGRTKSAYCSPPITSGPVTVR